MESPDVWTSDARWKFVLGHEFGHMVQDYAEAGLSASYRFTGDTSGGSQDDPSSATATPELTRDCSCSHIDPENRSHCLQSIEITQSAQQEGFGHFFASRLFNRIPDDPDFTAGVCNFTYYKQVSASDLVSTPLVHPVPINCAGTYGHRDGVCDPVTITGDPGGTELDWLAFYWDITTTPAQPVTVGELLGWYVVAKGNNQRTFAGLVQAASTTRGSTFIDFLNQRGAAHAID